MLLWNNIIWSLISLVHFYRLIDVTLSDILLAHSVMLTDAFSSGLNTLTPFTLRTALSVAPNNKWDRETLDLNTRSDRWQLATAANWNSPFVKERRGWVSHDWLNIGCTGTHNRRTRLRRVTRWVSEKNRVHFKFAFGLSRYRAEQVLVNRWLSKETREERFADDTL